MKKYILGILLSLVIISCVSEDALNGTWGSTPYSAHVYRFDNGNYEEFYDENILHGKGTYTTTGGKLTLYPTHARNTYLTESFKWSWGNYLTWEEDMVPISQARTELINQVIGREVGWFGHSDAPEEVEKLRSELEIKFKEYFDDLYPQTLGRLSVKGDTIVLKHEYGTSYLYRH